MRGARTRGAPGVPVGVVGARGAPDAPPGAGTVAGGPGAQEMLQAAAAAVMGT